VLINLICGVGCTLTQSAVYYLRPASAHSLLLSLFLIEGVVLSCSVPLRQHLTWVRQHPTILILVVYLVPHESTYSGSGSSLFLASAGFPHDSVQRLWYTSRRDHASCVIFGLSQRSRIFNERSSNGLNFYNPIFSYHQWTGLLYLRANVGD
jgi:hypothetical protein